MPTARHPQWQLRLQAVLDAKRDTPFAFGVHDCCTFPADCIEAVTGIDPMRHARNYKTEVGALRLIARAGGMAELLASFLGSEISPNQAQPGDVGLCTQGAAVVNVGGHWLAPSAQGMTTVLMPAVIRAWRCIGAAEGVPCLK